MRKTHEDLKNLSNDNLAYVRRMVRYNDLDPKQREKVDLELEKVEQQIAKNKVERDKRYEVLRAQSRTEQNERLVREEKMKKENPVFYQRMMERRREIEARIIGQADQ